MSVDDSALRDPRMLRLSKRLQWKPRETLGALLFVWAITYDRKHPIVPLEDVDSAADHDGFCAAMIAVGLAVDTPEGVLVKGAIERIKYLDESVESGRRGGLVTQAKRRAEHNSQGSDQATVEGTDRVRRGPVNPPPPDPSPPPPPVPDSAPDPDARESAAETPSAPRRAAVPTGTGVVRPGEDGERVDPIRMRVPPTFAAVQIARTLFAGVLTAQPAHRAHKWTETQRGATIARWAETLEILHRVDSVPMGEIEATVDWIAKEPFWSTTIAGADALRQHWDTIQGQRHRKQPERGFNAFDALDAAAERLNANTKASTDDD